MKIPREFTGMRWVVVLGGLIAALAVLGALLPEHCTVMQRIAFSLSVGSLASAVTSRLLMGDVRYLRRLQREIDAERDGIARDLEDLVNSQRRLITQLMMTRKDVQ